jgi:hypothetical protein
MVNGLCYLNYIEFILILGLFSLLFLRQGRKYLIRKLIGFILKLKRIYNKKSYNKNTNKRSFNKKINKNLSLNNTLNSVDKYTDYLTVFIFVCLFWIKFINIYFSSNLVADIDSFVNVYNHIKNSGLLFAFNFNYRILLRKSYRMPALMGVSSPFFYLYLAKNKEEKCYCYAEREKKSKEVNGSNFIHLPLKIWKGGTDLL